jgi:NTE family protein
MEHTNLGLNRREFLVSCAGVSAGGLAMSAGMARAATSQTGESDPKTVGLALGSGGANGLAHIPMLEVFDALDIQPKLMAGSSIGAIIGAMYASGLSGKKIRDIVSEAFSPDANIIASLLRGAAGMDLFDLLRTDLDDGGLLDNQGFLDFLQDTIQVHRFEELRIPLKVVAADYWKREQVIFDKGPLIPAIKASMAVPGLFAPVRYEEKLLVDGGTVNPLPFDLLRSECDVLVAIDVTGAQSEPTDTPPDVFDAIFNTFDIMQQAITREKMKNIPPDISIRPKITGVRLLHFNKSARVFEQSAPAARKLKKALLRFFD